jgi:hypothetical protein
MSLAVRTMTALWTSPFLTRPRDRFLHRDDDDVADAGETALRPAQHLDALDALRAAIVGDVEVGLHLDHRSNSFFTSTGHARRSASTIQART